MFFSPLEQFDSITLISFDFFGFDLSFNNISLPLFLLFFFVFVFRYLFRRAFRIIPSFWQFFFEVIFLFILDLVEQQIGHIGFIYFPFIFSLFTFILITNLISMTPFGFAITSHIVMIFLFTLTIGLSTVVIVLIATNSVFLLYLYQNVLLSYCLFLLLLNSFLML